MSPEFCGEKAGNADLSGGSWGVRGMTENPGRVEVRREGAEEECDGTGVEGRGTWRRSISQAHDPRSGWRPEAKV